MNEVDRQTIFSGVLRVLMKDRKLDEVTVGEKVHISKVSMGKYASGQALPKVDGLCRLADFFGITPDQLLGYRKLTEDKPKEEPKEKEPRRMNNVECAAVFRKLLSENGKTISDYKDISQKLHDQIYKNTKI